MKKVILICVAISTVIATIVLFLGLQHNSMGEFCIDPDKTICEIDLGYSFGIWASWFILSMLVSTIASVPAYVIYQKRK